MTPPALIEHAFRHDYGKLVATLCRRVGAENLEAVEDAVQAALAQAVEHWTVSGPPENPTAWLFRVARNRLLDELRTAADRRDLLAGATAAEAEPPPDSLLASELPDDLLRMLFVCCDDALPVESQLVLALKTLCGFGVGEIAARLFTSEANVYKRLERARRRLRELGALPEALSPDGYAARLPAVHNALYLLFTEGWLSASPTEAIRRELCDEAIRLGHVLASHPAGQVPETYALLALMHLHAARIDARQDPTGELLLLEEQDRSLWDQDAIAAGLEWLALSAEGDVYSRYHGEAAVAAEHCLAPSLAETRWDRIAASYALLDRASPSPLHRLNRAVAVAEWLGPIEGLAVVDGFEPPSWLAGSYLWSAVLADLHRRAGHERAASLHRARALETAPTEEVRVMLGRRLGTPSPT